MRTRTLTDLIADVRTRADCQALGDSDIAEFLNQSIADCQDMLISAFGNEYFEKETTLTTTPNLATVALPADFYEMTGLYWINGSYKYRITKMTPMESEQYIAGVGWNTFFDVHYIIQAANLKFVPTPMGTHSMTLKYIPASARLVNGSDPFDGYNGYEEWVVLDAAMKCLEREGNEVDSGLLGQRKARMEQRIQNMAARDQAEPARVQDTMVGGPWWRRNWR